MRPNKVRYMALGFNALIILSLVLFFFILRLGKPERQILASEFLRFALLFPSLILLGIFLTATYRRLTRWLGYVVIFSSCTFFASTAVLALYCYYLRSLVLAPDVAVLSRTSFGQLFWWLGRSLLGGVGALLFAGIFIINVVSALISVHWLRKAKKGGQPLPIAVCAFMAVVSSYAAGDGILARAIVDGIASARSEQAAMHNFYDFLAAAGERLSGRNVPEADIPAADGALYVLIIDSSANKYFMRGWHVPFATTPWLDSFSNDSGMNVLSNAYAASSVAGEALLLAISNRRCGEGEARESGPDRIDDSVIDAALRSGMEVVWLSNVLPASRSTVASSSAAGSMLLKGVFPEGRWPEDDELLLHELDKVIDNSTGKSCLVVLHLAGASPYPGVRTSNSRAKDMEVNRGWLGKLADNPPLLSAYRDYMANIARTDEILDSVMQRITSVHDRPAIVIYFSDVAGNFHARPVNYEFSWATVEIPIWVWLSDSYKDQNPERAATLKEHLNLIFPAYTIFDLFIGLSGVKSLYYSAKHDISSPAYSVGLQTALSNKHLAQDAPSYRIAAYLNDESLGHLGVHACNTLMKTELVVRAGIRRVEVDLIYDPKRGLLLGHDSRHETSLTFNDYLKRFSGKLDFIWLDVKNINGDTSYGILAELEYLDKVYSLKDRTLVESKNCEGLRPFTECGWQTSWYLGWRNVKRAVSENKTAAFATELAGELERNSVTAISYAFTADLEVQTWLIPKLPARTDSYCWNPDLSYFNDLKKSAPQHRHLRCLLVEFPTPFELF